MGLAIPTDLRGRAALGGVIVGLVEQRSCSRCCSGPAWAVGGLAAGAITFAVLAVRATDRLLESGGFPLRNSVLT